jgi:hypothetical protein
MTIDVIVTITKELQVFFFFGLIIVKRIVCFLHDVLVNEDEIVEQEVDEGTKNIN